MAAEFEGVPARPHAFTVRDVPAAEFVKAFAEHLKKGEFKVPEWAEYVKTGKGKELAPYDVDWFFVRAAAIARRIYLNPGIGVGALANTFGTGQRGGTRPTHHVKGSRKLARYICAQLEELGLLETIKGTSAEGTELAAGRRVTSQGRKDIDLIARSVYSDA